MDGSGAGGVVSGTPGDDREEPEVPPGVVGVVGVALRPLVVCVASGTVCCVLAMVRDGFLLGVESSCKGPKDGAVVSKVAVTGYSVVGVTS